MTDRGAAAAVVAVAGRRIDAGDAQSERFPLRNRPRVHDDVAAFLGTRPVAALVSSAACGADLLALEAAAERGIRFRIILPFSADRFRSSSVIDRPGNWGPLFDRLAAEALRRGDLVVLAESPSSSDTDDDAYARANLAILDEADAIASGSPRTALIVWDGASRGADDLTAQFRTRAATRGWSIDEIRTL